MDNRTRIDAMVQLLCTNQAFYDTYEDIIRPSIVELSLHKWLIITAKTHMEKHKKLPTLPDWDIYIDREKADKVVYAMVSNQALECLTADHGYSPELIAEQFVIDAEWAASRDDLVKLADVLNDNAENNPKSSKERADSVARAKEIMITRFSDRVVIGADDFPFLTMEDIEALEPYEFLVEDILFEQSIAMIFGAPGFGKSFLALDLCWHMATGKTWHTQPVRQAKIIYFYVEGVRGVRSRFKAWKKHHGWTAGNMVMVAVPLDLMRPENIKRLIRKCEKVGYMPDVVVFDTLARNFGGDENKTPEMNMLVKSADLLKETLGCTVLIVHHTNKGGDTYRGNTALEAALNTSIKVSYAKTDKCMTVSCEKQKDSEPFEKMYFKFQPVDIDEKKPGVILLPTIKKDKESAAVASMPKTTKEEKILAFLNSAGPGSFSGRAIREGAGISSNGLKEILTGLISRKEIQEDANGGYSINDPDGLWDFS